VTVRIRVLIDPLAALPGSERLFNPYSSAEPGGDIRQANLARYLADMQARRPDILMLFEAPGYRGCALSGIPVTSERIMLRGIARWGLFGEGYHATSGQPDGVAEMTATILWDALEHYAPEPPLIWNTLPLHPHRPDERQSNRTPSAAEQEIGLGLIQMVIDLFGCQTILAVGRTAQRAAARLGIEAIPLRHPSQGGKPEFVSGLAAVFGGGSEGRE
jgi:hypothetical protein